jgi:hypothetical protein
MKSAVLVLTLLLLTRAVAPATSEPIRASV